MKNLKTQFITIAEQVQKYVEDEILVDHIKVGDIVPSSYLAKVFKCNVSSVKNGVNFLVEDGTLTPRKGRAAVVADGAKERIIAKRKIEFKKHIDDVIKTAKLLHISDQDLKEIVLSNFKNE